MALTTASSKGSKKKIRQEFAVQHRCGRAITAMIRLVFNSFSTARFRSDYRRGPLNICAILFTCLGASILSSIWPEKAQVVSSQVTTYMPSVFFTLEEFLQTLSITSSPLSSKIRTPKPAALSPTQYFPQHRLH